MVLDCVLEGGSSEGRGGREREREKEGVDPWIPVFKLGIQLFACWRAMAIERSRSGLCIHKSILSAFSG